MKNEGENMEPQRALRNARGKPEHQEEALFNKILCALLVKRTKEEPRERQKKRPQGGKAQRRIYSLNSRCSLWSLWLKFDTTEFILRNILYERQKEISLQYKGKDIGKHRIDYLVEDRVIVELKAVEAMNKIYEAQLLTYLRAMNKRVGLLINFNVERVTDGVKRLVI
jgi:GxxExxY protein